MGKKGNLLTEAQVRQFMKLANLKPLTPGFVDGVAVSDGPIDESHGRGRGEGAAGYGHPDDDRPGARLREVEDEFLPDEEPELEEPLPDEEPELEEPELEEPFEEPLEEPEGAREVNVDDFLAALEVALEDVLGDEVEVEEEPPEEVEEEPLEEPGLEEPPLEEPLPGEEEVPELQEMINKITKRVAKRIVKEALQNKNKK